MTGDYEVGGYRAGWAVTLLHHLLAVAAGVAGLVGAPSPSAVEVLGYDAAAYLWSAGFVLMGTAAFVARVRRRVLAEIIAVCGIAAFRVLWAVMIFTVNPRFAQTGLSLLAGAVFLAGWSLTSLAWLRGAGDPRTSRTSMEELRDHLRDSMEAHKGDAR